MEKNETRKEQWQKKKDNDEKKREGKERIKEMQGRKVEKKKGVFKIIKY